MEIDEKNYEKWKDVLRNQLTSTASLFFVFSSAAFGFVVSKLLNKENSLGPETIKCLALSIEPLKWAFIFYILFMLSRLGDYFHTQTLYRKGYIAIDVRRKTKLWAWLTWILFGSQIIFLCVSFYYLKETVSFGILQK